MADHFVIMGVAGCGKSSVGAALARKMDIQYIDGDDLHPEANIRKMTAGIPLNDQDRMPWLAAIGRRMTTETSPVIIGCSALRKIYRDRIRQRADSKVTFLHLSGSREVIEARMSARRGHFMPVKLLDSQFATLEELEPDEDFIKVNIDQPFEAIVDELFLRIGEG